MKDRFRTRIIGDQPAGKVMIMKASRQNAINEIISNEAISTQEELGAALRANGFEVTQATISRDIKAMRLIKINDKDGGYRYAVPENPAISRSEERMRKILQDNFITIDHSANIIVVKTLPGGAQSVASAIDSFGIKKILGTVAGDDTIFIVVKAVDSVTSVIQELRQIIYPA